MSDAYQPGDRRPITSRDLKLSRAASAWLAARGVSPNAISLAGMFIGLAAGTCFALTRSFPPWETLLWILGAVGVQLRLLANMLDGMVAIQSGRASPVGELFNEIPDRISDSAALIGLGMAANSDLSLGFAAALAAIFTAYIRAVGNASGVPQEFCGPMAKPQRMFLVTLLALFFAFAPRDWRSISDVSLIPIVLTVIIAGCGLTALRRLVRIVASLQSRQP